MTEKLFTLSTSHLTQETCDGLSIADSYGICAYPNRYGAFVLVLPADLLEFGRHEPADLATVIDWARTQGVDWLKFDADGPVVECLPTWEW